MTNAGWYPDPAGAPDTYRYWDGQSWSQMTTSHPPAAAQQPTPPTPQQPQQPQSPGAAPTQFPPQPPQSPQPNQGGYGAVPQPPTPGYGTGGFSGGPGGPGGYPQQQWSPQPSGGSGGGSGKVIGIVIAAVLVLVLLGVGGFFGVRALSGDDDDNKRAADPSRSESSSDATDGTDPTDETSGPTEVPTNSAAPTGIQCTGGSPDPATDPGTAPATITGGGLTIPVPSGYTVDVRLSTPHSFADGVLVAYKSVEENWITEFAVGGLPRANGFDDLADAAEIIMKCLTTNDEIYEGFSERKDLTNEAITVDGKPAHRITSEIKVDNPEVVAEGDVTSVIVVDTGDAATFGLFLGVATIGEPTSIALVETEIEAMKVG